MSALDKTISCVSLVSLFVETLVFGLHVATCVPCVKAIVWDHGSLKPACSIRWWLLAVAVLMLAVSTLDVGLLFRHNLEAFIYYRGDGGPGADLLVLSSYINVGKGVAFGVQTCLGELVLLYRCYTVWGKKWHVIIIPALLQVAANFSAFTIPYLEARSSNGLVTSCLLNRWTTLGICLTTAMEIITTGLICFKMWSVSRRSASLYFSSSSGRKSPVRTAMIIFMESGFIMAVGYTIFLITSFTQSIAIYPVSDATTPLIGVTFNLIVIRIADRREMGSTIPTSQPSYPLRALAAARDGSRQPHVIGTNIQVDVATAVDYDGDLASSKLEANGWTH